MTRTSTPEITIASDARRFIDKEYRGVRIDPRVGPITRERAEQRLQMETIRVLGGLHH
jgi:hypothetical protein